MNGGAYIMVVIGILAAKCLGFLRDIVFASVFGASEYTDIYFQVFGLASLVFTGIGGALSTLVIKNLNKSENSTEQRQKQYVAQFIGKTAIVTIAITALLYALAGPIVKLLLPGLAGHMHDDAVKIMYIMLPSCLFVIVAYIMSGVLQNSGVFFVTSVMSLPYNAVIIASLLAPSADITTVSIITTVGWFLHIVILLPSFLKKGYRLAGSLRGAHSGKENNREAFYIFISGMMFQLVFMADKASVTADSGAASTINYASNLFVTIASVFVVAMSNVSYPSICRHFESGNTDMVKKLLGYIITVLMAIFVPFMLTVTCFGGDIISLLYERGEFTERMSADTALLFGIYTFGFFGYVCQELLGKVLYLDGKYRYTVAGTIAAVALKPIINTVIAKGNPELVALSTTVIFSLYAVCILFAITKSVGNYFSAALCKNIGKIALAGASALIVYELSKNLALPLSGTELGFAVKLALCGVAYVAVLAASGCVKYIVSKR